MTFSIALYTRPRKQMELMEAFPSKRQVGSGGREDIWNMRGL